MRESYERDDATDTLIGDDLINLLGLKRKRNGRVGTAWGDKTPCGLARTVRRVLAEAEPKGRTPETTRRAHAERRSLEES